ncbi:high-affinity lysophosphatidic acid receptor-like [Saccoglossus kowalevskii]|uniref:High-affinity lysophosphatidic acid receptor-like n=1 Tax=Saccoglossus kowalevskii TaxID=10224 RepID=A0ABM0GJ68_SACKO|nr:PREDICTED: high-affinity lysophosphatidic acid receptor-like [Saccoglossus kowalevskii]
MAGVTSILKTTKFMPTVVVNSTNVSSLEEVDVYPGLPLSAVVPLAAIMILMITVNVLGNSIVCLIVYQKPAMRSSINLLLANLAFADILIAITCMPFALVTIFTTDWVFGKVMCQISAFLHVLFCMEAIYILATISIDRYFIIVRRKDKLNPYRARIMIGTSWIFSCLISIPPIFGWSGYVFVRGSAQCLLERPDNAADAIYAIIQLLCLFYLPCILMSYSYLCILNTVRRNSCRVQNHPESLSVSQANKLGLTGITRPARVNVDMSFKTRAFTTILLLFIVFVICWVPYAITHLIVLFGDNYGQNYLLETIILWLSYLNSAFNPIIYCWRIKKFREACREIIPKTFKLWPKLPGRTQRRIRPSAIYECNDQSVV